MKIRKLGRALKRNLPTILSFVACIGVGATSILAIQDHADAMEDPPKNAETFSEKASWVGKHYWRSALSGILTGACILTSNGLNKKAQAKITGAYIALDQLFKKYRSAVQQVGGEEFEKKVNMEMAKNSLDETQNYHWVDEDDEEQQYLFYIPIAESNENNNQSAWFYSSLTRVQSILNVFRQKYFIDEKVSLNYFLEMFNLEPISRGNFQGWSWDAGLEYGYSEPKIKLVYVEGEDDTPPYYMIDFETLPSADYVRY